MFAPARFVRLYFLFRDSLPGTDGLAVDGLSHRLPASPGGSSPGDGAVLDAKPLPARQGGGQQRRGLPNRREGRVLTYSGALRLPPGSNGCGAADPA